MNGSMIRYIVFRVLEFQAVFLLFPCLVALAYGESEGWAYFVVMLACFLIAFFGKRKKPASNVFFAREGFVTVSLCWIIMGLTGAVPFLLTGEIPSFTDALFETVSGFTTTGSSILTDVEALSHCSLFWRSFTHWIGGMGVLVLVMAILPLSGGYNMYLMRAESPGPSVDKLVPRVRYTARILYGIYIAMTILLIVILLCCGMNFFEAATHAFGTAGTGGFGIKNDSIGSYSVPIQVVLTIFMILFGVNFQVYHLILRGKPKAAMHHEEARYYFLIIFVAVALITWNVRGMFGSILEALQQVFFQVASIITTTGFATTDFNLWPGFSKTILVLLMFIGACAGSTGGGMKVSRIVILFRLIKNEIYYLLHPKRVTHVRFEHRAVSKETVRTVEVFLIVYILLFSGSVLLISLNELDLTTNFTAVAATLNNIGPGLELVGPTGNFSVFNGLSKWVLILDMLAGRLEIFPLLVLMAPSTWKRK